MKAPQFWSTLYMELGKEDKKKHMTWSFWLLVGTLLFTPLPWAVFLVFLLGLAKEVWDEHYGSGFCLYDMVGNCIGMASGIVVGLPIKWMIHA